MLKYLPYAIQGLAMIGGVAGGLWMKSAMTPSAPEESPAHEEADAHAAASDHATADDHGAKPKEGKKDSKKDAKKRDKKADKGGHGGGHGEGGDESAYGFMKFSRQFVVPVLGEAGVTSLIVLDLNIEVPSSETETIYQQEPKLRDSMLATLLSLSNTGAFSSELLEQGNLDTIRAQLLQSARAVIGESAQNVLILNITRQDV
jgi:hypothetical protein